MKSILLLLLILSLFPHRYIAQETLNPEVPTAIRSELDRRFLGWEFPVVRDEIRSFLREHISPNARPEIIIGDFDGNGQSDYAMLIEYGVILNGNGETIGKNSYIVAFLKREDIYDFYMVNFEGGGEYITLIRRGGRDYDYETDGQFTYENDAIFAGIFEKAGVSYVYEEGRFRAIVTSD